MWCPTLKLPPVIHIAGTNGKGSVSAFLRSMAEAAGQSCHVYNSPHLCRFHERIRLNGDYISEDELVDVLSEVEKVNGSDPITFFESTTVAAFLAFAHHPADLLILETGLGGVFDHKAVPDTARSIITPIAFDHEQFWAQHRHYRPAESGYYAVWASINMGGRPEAMHN